MTLITLDCVLDDGLDGVNDAGWGFGRGFEWCWWHWFNVTAAPAVVVVLIFQYLGHFKTFFQYLEPKSWTFSVNTLAWALYLEMRLSSFCKRTFFLCRVDGRRRNVFCCTLVYCPIVDDFINKLLNCWIHQLIMTSPATSSPHRFEATRMAQFCNLVNV